MGTGVVRGVVIRGSAELVGTTQPASEDVVATWMRAEAGLVEVCPDAAARLRGTTGNERLVLEMPVLDAATALTAVGRRTVPLAREHAGAKKSVVDRPKGVPRISKMKPDE